MESATLESCLNCTLRPDRPFCDLPSGVLEALDAVKSTRSYPRNTVLFRQGQPARGAFVLCEGRAKLTVCSESGKSLTLRIADPGDVLGLSASLSEASYEVTAELLEDAQVVFVRRKDLLRFLREHRDACLHVVTLLSQDLHVAYDRVRSVAQRRTRPAQGSVRRAHSAALE